MSDLQAREMDRWMRRTDRSCAPRYNSSDFVGMFGMCEMEVGVADIVNKAQADCCLIADVHFDAADLKTDSDAFRELRAHGWIIESHGRYKLDAEAVARVHKRWPNV